MNEIINISCVTTRITTQISCLDLRIIGFTLHSASQLQKGETLFFTMRFKKIWHPRSLLKDTSHLQPDFVFSYYTYNNTTPIFQGRSVGIKPETLVKPILQRALQGKGTGRCDSQDLHLCSVIVGGTMMKAPGSEAKMGGFSSF